MTDGTIDTRTRADIIAAVEEPDRHSIFTLAVIHDTFGIDLNTLFKARRKDAQAILAVLIGEATP